MQALRSVPTRRFDSCIAWNRGQGKSYYFPDRVAVALSSVFQICGVIFPTLMTLRRGIVKTVANDVLLTLSAIGVWGHFALQLTHIVRGVQEET